MCVPSLPQEIDPVINAAPILCFERARKAAANLKIPANPGPGYLYGTEHHSVPQCLNVCSHLPYHQQICSSAAGLPILVKDTAAVKGILWTMVSRSLPVSMLA